MKNISLPTAIVVLGGIIAVCFMAYFKVDQAYFAGAAAAIIGLAGALKQLVGASKDSDAS